MELSKIQDLIDECYEISEQDGFDWMLNTELEEVQKELNYIKSILSEAYIKKPKDTKYMSGIVNLELIKRDIEGSHYKATPIEKDFTQNI